MKHSPYLRHHRRLYLLHVRVLDGGQWHCRHHRCGLGSMSSTRTRSSTSPWLQTGSSTQAACYFPSPSPSTSMSRQHRKFWTSSAAIPPVGDMFDSSSVVSTVLPCILYPLRKTAHLFCALSSLVLVTLVLLISPQ